MSKSSIGTEPVYDARTLGKPRMFILGLQHMFAMFGATVLVPALSGLDVATTLLFAGLGTLLFHLLTKGKVPAFLGSSFAFIGGYNAVRTIGTNADGSAIYNNDLLAYACFGVAIAGLMYIILSTLFKIFGVKKVMRYFPPIVTGPIIIAIGLTLSSSAITNCRANWLVAVVAILIVIGFNMWGKGMAKIIPILLGVLGSYIFALIVDPAERASVAAAVSSAKWFGLPIFWKNSVFHLFAGPVDSGVLWASSGRSAKASAAADTGCACRARRCLSWAIRPMSCTVMRGVMATMATTPKASVTILPPTATQAPCASGSRKAAVMGPEATPPASKAMAV